MPLAAQHIFILVIYCSFFKLLIRISMSCLFSDSFGGSQPFHSCWPSSFMMKLDVSTCVAIPEAGWNKKPTIKQISKHPSPPQKRNTTTTTTLPHIILLHILFLLYGCFIHFKLSSSAAIHEVIKKQLHYSPYHHHSRPLSLNKLNFVTSKSTTSTTMKNVTIFQNNSKWKKNQISFFNKETELKNHMETSTIYTHINTYGSRCLVLFKLL